MDKETREYVAIISLIIGGAIAWLCWLAYEAYR